MWDGELTLFCRGGKSRSPVDSIFVGPAITQRTKPECRSETFMNTEMLHILVGIHAITIHASIATRCRGGGVSWSEQVWTGFQWWPLDVTSRGPHVWMRPGLGGPCAMRSHVAWSGDGQGQGDLYSEVQCIMRNGDMGLPPLSQQNGRHLWKHYLPTTSLAGGKNTSEQDKQHFITFTP